MEVLTICSWDEGANGGEGGYTYKSGVSYDSGAKKLTVNLETALESYTDFKNAADVNLVLDCAYPSININALGIVSVNIVP
jgi:hypothetical protein